MIKPKHVVKYKNLLIFKSTPPENVSLSARGNHRPVESGPSFLPFWAGAPAALTEAVSDAVGGLSVSIGAKGGPLHPRGLWEMLIGEEVSTLSVAESISITPEYVGLSFCES